MSRKINLVLFDKLLFKRGRNHSILCGELSRCRVGISENIYCANISMHFAKKN